MKMKKLSNLDKDQLMEIICILTEIVQQGLDFSSVITLITERAQALTNADGAVIELVEDSDLVYRATSGMAEKQLGLRMSIDSSLSGLSYKTGESFLCIDSETDNRVDRDACRVVGLRSMAIVPLIHDGSPVGVLKVFSSKVSMFGQQTIDLLELMSGVIASSMVNAAKYESDELFYRATYDPLTGVANRSLFYDRLRQRCSQAKRTLEQFGVVSVDVDGLKIINDTLGHRAGDEVLMEVAHRMQSIVREADTVARLGGDEFGIIIYKIESPENAQQLIQRLKEMISKPFRFDNHDIVLSVSAGFALFDESCTEIADLLDFADKSMYTEKVQHRKMLSHLC
ncbi:MAG TPA: GGDEF domain-containing protein [Clostridiales bacterium UBA8960]|nr:GGDEF domain-containing protein [Clostridiales bacterium UBA8960]